MINYPFVGKVIGIIVFFVGVLMLVPVVFSFVSDSPDHRGILLCALLTMWVGFSAYRFTRHHSDQVGKREGYLIVVLGWICTASFGHSRLWCPLIPSLTATQFSRVFQDLPLLELLFSLKLRPSPREC